MITSKAVEQVLDSDDRLDGRNDLGDHQLAALRGMREDRVAQAILRFARGDSGAVVALAVAGARERHAAAEGIRRWASVEGASATSVDLANGLSVQRPGDVD